MTPKTLCAFFALAFGLGWGILALLILFTTQIEAIFGEISGTNPVFILAVYSPAIAGVFLVWRHYGIRGLGSYLRAGHAVADAGRLVDGPRARHPGGQVPGRGHQRHVGEFPFSPWYGVLPGLATALLIGPVEEFGWRGVALPLLQSRYAPLRAMLTRDQAVAEVLMPAEEPSSEEARSTPTGWPGRHRRPVAPRGTSRPKREEANDGPTHPDTRGTTN